MYKVLFLYTEIASYFTSCLDHLLQNSQNVEVHLVRWPINSEAPFQFQLNDKIHVYERNDFSTEELIALYDRLSPNAVFVSGWIDKGYMKVCKHINRKIPVLVGMDNQWVGSIRQKLATIISPFTVKRHFTHAWVAGKPQQTFAKKLGFSDEHILMGYYSADHTHFAQFYLDNQKNKEANFPKRFLYVGRYIQHKGVWDLWNAFIEMQEENPNEWELWCIGTGELENQAPQHPKIKHLGFIQPKDIAPYIRDTGIFVLPSHKEPWGVVIHEYAAAGFPIIASNKVGAATTFVEEGKNGYLFTPENVAQIKQSLINITQMPTEQLLEMSKQSHALSYQITPATWSETLMNVLKQAE